MHTVEIHDNPFFEPADHCDPLDILLAAEAEEHEDDLDYFDNDF